MRSPLRRLRRLLLVIFVASLSASCRKSNDALLVVSVTSSITLQNVRSLGVTIASATDSGSGKSFLPLSFGPDAGLFLISDTAVTVGVNIPSDTGPIIVSVRAYGSGSQILAYGSSPPFVPGAGESIEVKLSLTVVTQVDAGVSDAPTNLSRDAMVESPVDADGTSDVPQKGDAGTIAADASNDARYDGDASDVLDQLEVGGEVAADPCGGAMECEDIGAGLLGVQVPSAGSCPSGFGSTETELYQGPNPGQECSGCACSMTTTCTSTVFGYADITTCRADIQNDGGRSTKMTTLEVSDSANTNSCAYESQSWLLTPFAAATTCNQTGAAVLPAITWGNRTKFCATNTKAPSCASGTCLPNAQGQTLCVLTAGSANCPPSFSAIGAGVWYENFSDKRECSTCSCTYQGSGDCSGVEMNTSGNGCHFGDNPPFTVSAPACQGPIPDGVASFWPEGTPVSPSCNSISTITGIVDTSGAYTLCCQN